MVSEYLAIELCFLAKYSEGMDSLQNSRIMPTTWLNAIITLRRNIDRENERDRWKERAESFQTSFLSASGASY